MSGLWMRRAGLVLGCSAALSIWGVHEGKAEISRGAFEASEGLFELAETWGAGGRRVHVNGLVFEVASHTLPLAPRDVLDRLQASCRARDAGWDGRLGQLLEAPRPEVSATSFRLSAEDVGMVGCLDLGEEDLSVAALVGRMERLVQDGDLRHLGPVRLARVEPVDDGGSHLVTIASRGPMRLDDAFPESGDAAGIDSEGVPRPQGARRMLSAYAEHRGPSLHIYWAPSGHEQGGASAWLAQWRAAGWELEPAEGMETGIAWAASKAEQLRVAAVERTDDGIWFTVLSLIP